MLTFPYFSDKAVETLHFSSQGTIATNSGFIPKVARVSLPASPHLRALSCAFDTEFYHDGLFDILEVMCPAQLKGAVIKRKAEYLAGRYLCRLLLEAEGLPGQVLIGRQRQPVWPATWLGSITHSANQAMVVLWQNQTGRVLGLDLESWISAATAKTIENQITLPGELDRLHSSMRPEHLLTLAFSAKESLYKALSAKVGKFFDFHSAQLYKIDEIEKSFTLRLTQSLSGGFSQGDCFEGHYLSGSEQVLTWIANTFKPHYWHSQQ